MKLSLPFAGQVLQAGHYISDEFAQLAASIQNSWDREHRDDGSHGNMTAITARLAEGLFEYLRPRASGDWEQVPFAASNYTANGTSWTVGSGGIFGTAYMLHNKTMFFQIVALGTTVGALTDELRFKIPGGFLSKMGARGAITLIDNGGAEEIGFFFVDKLTAYIGLHRIAGAQWTAAANCHVWAQGFFDIIQN